MARFFLNSRHCEIYDVIKHAYSYHFVIVIAVMYINNSCLRSIVKKAGISQIGKKKSELHIIFSNF